MNKMELVTAMAEKSGLSKKDCEAALNAMTETVTDALKAEDKVQLVGSAPSRQRSVPPARAVISGPMSL